MEKQQRIAYRHGDIVFERAVPKAEWSGTPTLDKPRQHLVIAKGEATGHAHVLDGEVLVYGSVEELLLPAGRETGEIAVVKPSTLTHPEHKPITLPPGRYTVRRQREFWGESRYVAD